MINLNLTKPIISLDEVLRYLGYNGQDISSQLMENIKSCIDKVISICTPRCVCSEFDILHNKDGINLKNTSLILPGKDINKLLNNCKSCYIFAATIGSEIDRVLSYYQNIDMAKAVIMDAAATAGIEALCDDIQNQLENIAKKRNLLITWRFSCGYGDLTYKFTAADIINIKCTEINGYYMFIIKYNAPTKISNRYNWVN